MANITTFCAVKASPAVDKEVAGCGDGYELVVEALKKLGVKLMFGVVGIPVTPLASSAQVALAALKKLIGPGDSTTIHRPFNLPSTHI